MKNLNFSFEENSPDLEGFFFNYFFSCLSLVFIPMRVIFSYGGEEPLDCELINVIFRVYFPSSGVCERRRGSKEETASL